MNVRLTVKIGSLLVALAGFVAMVAMGSKARAAEDMQVCGPEVLHGTYVFTARGFNIVSGAAQPKAIVEGIIFNGDGTLSVPFATVSINGTIVHVPPGGTGAYTVDSTCQGTLVFNTGPVNYDLYVERNGRQIQMIQTDANTVFQGLAKRVSR